MTPDNHQGFHVEELLDEGALQLSLVAGAKGSSRILGSVEVQRPGLALTGHLAGFEPQRVQVIGKQEASYIDAVAQSGTQSVGEHLEALCRKEPPCIIITEGYKAHPALQRPCDQLAIPLLLTPLSASRLVRLLERVLVARLGAFCTTHGVLVDVFGVGVLLLGASGIGKSEVALELVLRGHMLVADDVVELHRGIGAVYGTGPKLLKHHIEIRGLGILNIKDLFGIAAVRDSKRVDLVAELSEWENVEKYDRLGVDEQCCRYLETEIPLVRLPVRPGRNLSTIIEVAARNQLLKRRGHHSARKFHDRMARALANEGYPDQKHVDGAFVDGPLGSLDTTLDVE